MEQDPTLPNQTADSQKSLVTKLINHYEPNVDVTDDYYKSISEKYQDVDTLVTKLINHYEPDSEVTTDYLDGLYGKYGVKKKRADRTNSTSPGGSFTRSWGCFGRTYTNPSGWSGRT